MNKHFRAFGKRLIADLLANAQVIVPAEQHWTTRLIDSQTLANSTFNRRWLIKGLLVADQPGVIGGAKKLLKTSFMIAMAICISSGLSFLGKFEVIGKKRVAVFSGESGDSTIQDTAKRICASKQIDLSSLDILWSFDLPQFSKPDDLKKLGELIREKEIKVIFIDPLYLCLLSGTSDISASNLYQMGPLLKEIARVCLTAGATPIFVHHCKKGSSKTLKKPELSDLAFSGVEEFVRQWVLVSRRKHFVPGSGHHDLWMVAGGSAGQSGEWGLIVREGRMGDDFQGRYWETRFLEAGELAVERKAEDRDKLRTMKKEDMKKVICALRGCLKGETKTEIFKAAKLNSNRGGSALRALEGRGKVEPCKVVKNGKSFDGFRIAKPGVGKINHTEERRTQKERGRIA